VSYTDEEREDLSARMGDSSFWYDPHTIPQYDLLVADGFVSREEADEHRRGREEMGLPMTFADLKPRPHPAFEWLLQAGGPVVVSDDFQRLEIDGRSWTADNFGSSKHGKLTHHMTVDGDDDGYEVREIGKAFDTSKGEVEWSASRKIGTGIYARVRDCAPDFETAVRDALALSFVPTTLCGLDFLPSGYGWQAGAAYLANYGGHGLEIHKWTKSSEEETWTWKLDLEKGSVLSRLAELFNAYQLGGQAATKEAAVQDAMAAATKVKLLCAELIGDGSFESGRQTGRDELRAQIIALLP